MNKEELGQSLADSSNRQRNELLTGTSRHAQEWQMSNMARRETFGSTVDRAFNTENGAVALGRYAAIQAEGILNPDIGYDSVREFDKVRSQINPGLWNSARNARSLTELYSYIEWSNQENEDKALLQRAGFSGTVASSLAMMTDVDLPIMLASGGSFIGPKTAALAGRATGHLSRRAVSMGYVAGAGAEAAAVSDVANRLLQVDYESADLPGVVLGGLLFGGTLGAFLPADKLASQTVQQKLANTRLKRVLQSEIDPAAADAVINNPQRPFSEVDAKTEAPVASKTADDTPAPRGQDDVIPPPETPEWKPSMNVDESVGAARIGAKYGIPENPATDHITDYYYQVLDEMGWKYKPERDTPWESFVDDAEEFLTKLPWLRTDQDNFLRSSSVTAQAIGLIMAESASGKHRVLNGTAGVLKKKYENSLLTNVAVHKEAMTDYFSRNKLPNTTENRQKFTRLGVDEMDARYYGEGAGQSSDPAVKAWADAMDQNFKRALDLMQEAGVYGSANIDWHPGWMPQRWSGKQFTTMLSEMRVSQDQIIDALTVGYRSVNPQWTNKMARTVSKAVMNRAIHMDGGIDTNLTRMLQSDGRTALAKYFENSGMSRKEVDTLLDGLSQHAADKGKARILKHRNEIDMRTQIPGTNYTLRDLTEQNILQVNSQYARSASGYAAVAKASGGRISGKNDWDLIKEAILHEQLASPSTRGNLKPEDIDNMWTALTGGALSASVSPIVRRLINLSNLSLLSQMGFPQAAETGIIIAVNGFEAFSDMYPLIREIRKDPTNPKWKKMSNDLEEMGMPIRGEQNLIRYDMQLDDITGGVTANQAKSEAFGEAMGKFFANGGGFDNLLGKGARLQGYTSGFYAIQQGQHWLASRMFMQSFGKTVKGTRNISKARRHDMGFMDDAVWNSVKKDWTDHVTYEKIGGREIVTDLNLDKWSAKNRDHFENAMNRAVYQQVQKGLVGENSRWFTNSDIGALMSNLRTFSLVGLQKQTLRNMRIADPVAMASVLYGVPMAALVYALRQAVNGRTENLDSDSIVRGGLSYSNVTAPVGMLTDPLTAILGLDDLQFNTFGARDLSGQLNVIPEAPAAGALKRMSNIPTSVWNLASGEGKAADVSAIMATPILGGMVVVNGTLNGIRADVREAARQRGRERAAETRRVAREQQAVETTVQGPEATTESEIAEESDSINVLNVLDRITGG